jgi:hypothetical protein
MRIRFHAGPSLRRRVRSSRRCLRSRTTATAAARPGHQARIANAGFGQLKLDVVSGGQVARKGRHHRAHLLVTGGHQEVRGAAITLGADTVIPGLGVRQFAVAMRAHRAAAMLVRVDQRRQCIGALQPGIMAHAQLARELQVGPRTGGRDDALDPFDRARAAVGCGARHLQMAPFSMQRFDAEIGMELEPARFL